MIINLIWDADGTLFNTYPTITEALRLALVEFGAEIPAERISRLVNVSFSHAVGTLADDLDLDTEALNCRFYEILALLPPEAQGPFPGATALCNYARSLGGQNYIVTHRGRASLERLLEVHGIAHLFTDLITADDAFPRKPDPAAFLALLERQAIDPAVTLAIGDRELDILAARDAGLRTSFYGTNPHEVTADVEVTDYALLLGWLVRENAPESVEAEGIFWRSLDMLVGSSQLVIDRPAGSTHPRYPDFVYPLDYGYLAGTSAADGGGIDVWVGTEPTAGVVGIIVTVDLIKRDSEIKILLGCTDEELETVLRFHDTGPMAAVLLERSLSSGEA